MEAAAFTTSLPLRTAARPRGVCPYRIPICAKTKKGKKSKKPRKASPSPQQTPQPKASPPTSQRSSQPSPESTEAPKFPGPIAPELLPDTPGPDIDFSEPTDLELPVADESSLRLPDLNAPAIRRKRKPREAPAPEPQEVNEDAPLTTDAIRKLTKAYREGGEPAQELISEIEKNPDYLIQTGNPSGEYDLASAIIGSGRPNKQGLYLLPYLQSGHLLLLTIILVIAFVYYPGFPLTEADDSVREGLKKGLALVGTFNAVLSVFAYGSAKNRGQPAAFWALKTAFLGDLAFGELRRNAPLLKDKDEEEKT